MRGLSGVEPGWRVHPHEVATRCNTVLASAGVSVEELGRCMIWIPGRGYVNFVELDRDEIGKIEDIIAKNSSL